MISCRVIFIDGSGGEVIKKIKISRRKMDDAFLILMNLMV